MSNKFDNIGRKALAFIAELEDLSTADAAMDAMMKMLPHRTGVKKIHHNRPRPEVRTVVLCGCPGRPMAN
jgi:hypothetical protein